MGDTHLNDWHWTWCSPPLRPIFARPSPQLTTSSCGGTIWILAGLYPNCWRSIATKGKPLLRVCPPRSDSSREPTLPVVPPAPMSLPPVGTNAVTPAASVYKMERVRRCTWVTDWKPETDGSSARSCGVMSVLSALRPETGRTRANTVLGEHRRPAECKPTDSHTFLFMWNCKSVFELRSLCCENMFRNVVYILTVETCFMVPFKIKIFF